MYVQTARKARLDLLTAVRLLDLVKVFSPVLPEIEFPDEKISLDEKVIFTIGAGLLFILSHLPIYGLIKDAPLKMTDPFPALRPLYAMEQGTLLELGLLPVITAAFVWQIAAGLRMVKVNLSYSQERELFQSAQKLTSFTLAVVFGVALVFSGYYEPVVRGAGSTVSWTTYVLILTQIVGWNFLLTLIVEVIDKGYGFGSGIVCLLSLNAATRLVRDVVGLEMVSTVPGGKPETYGVAIYLIKALFSFDLTTIKNAVIGVFSRAGFPTIGQVILALVTGLATIVLQNFRVELPIRSNKARGTANVFPIRLLYTGALPVLFAFTVLANAQITLHFASVFVEPFYPIVAHLFESRSETGKVVSGLAFYISAPASFTESLLSPIRGVVYTSLILEWNLWFCSKRHCPNFQRPGYRHCWPQRRFRDERVGQDYSCCLSNGCRCFGRFGFGRRNDRFSWQNSGSHRWCMRRLLCLGGLYDRLPTVWRSFANHEFFGWLPIDSCRMCIDVSGTRDAA